MRIPWLEIDDPFPEVHLALTQEQGYEGLLAAGADLSPNRLINAYENGIFPWHDDPIMWFCPHPRMVLYLKDFIISHSLKKKIRQVRKSISTGEYRLSFDEQFENVVKQCSLPRKHQNGTWISQNIIDAYTKLHKMGLAHSSEFYHNGQLVGGAYGVCLGRMFYGESMFARETDASKIALANLVFLLKQHDFELIDCQQETSHLSSLGAKTINRDDFINHLKKTTSQKVQINWSTASCVLNAI